MNDEPLIYREAQRRIIEVRASSMPGLFDCAYRWAYIHIDGNRGNVSGRMALGTAIHKATAVYDDARMRGRPIKPDDAAGTLVDHLKDPGEHVQWDPRDITKREAEAIGLALHGKYCTHFSPQYTFAAVELNLGALDIDVPSQGATVRIKGTLDRSRARYGEHGGVGITDLKSGKNAVTKPRGAERYVATTKGHGFQIGVYEILYSRKLGQPITEPAEIIGLGTTPTAPIARSTIANASGQVLGRDETPEAPAAPSLIEIAAKYMRHDFFPPNPKSQVCSPKYCPRWSKCTYHE